MARGTPDSGYYSPLNFDDKDEKNAGLVQWISSELEKISQAFQTGLAKKVEILNVAPTRPRDGMITGADGTNWNPGSGEGVYCYYNGAWHFLG